jgi:hypothetical protein
MANDPKLLILVSETIQTHNEMENRSKFKEKKGCGNKQFGEPSENHFIKESLLFSVSENK